MGGIQSNNENGDARRAIAKSQIHRVSSADQNIAQMSSVKLKKFSKRKGQQNLESPNIDPAEIERRFDDTLKKMDLPLNKAKALRNYDIQKKWKMIRDQEKVADQGSPAMYIEKLKACYNADSTGSRKQKRVYMGQDTSTVVLKRLEISLRTNSIDWVREFLNEQNNGLDVLVFYLKAVQNAGGLQVPPHLINVDPVLSRKSSSLSMQKRDTVSRKSSATSGSTMTNRLTLEDDIHICINCLRAIMNNSSGFNMVFNDTEAIDCIVRSILHPNLRTKNSVLHLLMAICWVKGGHDLVLGSFDRFRKEFHEEKRFQTFFYYFTRYDEFQIDFMVNCMQFINILVHSHEDAGYRLFLQQEFKLLGLEDYLEKLKNTESDELHARIVAYLDNMYDMTQLLEDSEQRNLLQQNVEDLQMKLSRANEKLQDLEADYVSKLGQLDYRMTELLKERDSLLSIHKKTDKDLDTLRKTLSEKDEKAYQERKRLESRIQELEELQKSFNSGLANVRRSSKDRDSGNNHPPTPVPPATVIQHVPPPPPPPPSFEASVAVRNSNVPPPPPLLMPSSGGIDSGVMTIKQKIRTKYKLPTLNWTALKPNQLKGTVFANLDDEKILKSLNFDDFEEVFKMGVSTLPDSDHKANISATEATSGGTPKKQTMLLDPKRIRNVAITRRKLAMAPVDLMKAVNQFDLKLLDLENVEILLHILPTVEEIKVFKDYETKHKSVQDLSPEDQFMIQISKIERLSQKLNIMSLMGNFDEIINLLNPSLSVITAASKSVTNAERFQKVLELILAFGNYMNSAKRGAVYGFKLQSLETLIYLKAPASKNFTFLHYLAYIIRSVYPDLLNFTQELKFVEKASSISLENVLTDFTDFEKNLDMSRKECSLRGSDSPPAVLMQFVTMADAKCNEVKKNVKVAQESFRECSEFYGESPKTSTTSFFAILWNFSKQFQQADEENIARQKAEMMQNARDSNRISKRNHATTTEMVRNNQAAVLDEMSQKGGRQKLRKLDLNEMGLGTLDDMISDITSHPYIDNSAPKRQKSFRDQQRPTVVMKRRESKETEI